MAEHEKVTLSFDAGLTEIYIPSTGATIYLNLEDVGLFKRLQDTLTKIEKIVAPLGPQAEQLQAIITDKDRDETSAALSSLLTVQEQVEGEVRAALHSCFGFDICKSAFGAMSCLSPCKSAPTVLHSLIEYLLKLYSERMAKAGKESQVRTEKYIKKYKQLEKQADKEYKKQVKQLKTPNTHD